MKRVLSIIALIIVPWLHAGQSLPYNLLSQLQNAEQKNGEQQEKESISYSEAAYHMAEGAAVTAICCLPSILCFKGFGFETMYKNENKYYLDYHIYPICAGLLNSSSGIPCIGGYALKIYNARRPGAVKKEYNQQLRAFTIEPVSDQDKLNASAKCLGSVLSIAGMTLGYCYCLKFK